MVRDIENFRSNEGGVFKNIGTGFRMMARYGYMATTEGGMQAAIGQERQNQAGWQSDIDIYKNFQMGQRVRDQARARRQTLLSEAATARGGSITGLEDLGEQAGALAGQRAGDLRNESLGEIAAAYRALAQIGGQLKSLRESAVSLAEGGRMTEAVVSQLKSLIDAQREAEIRIRNLEGAARNSRNR